MTEHFLMALLPKKLCIRQGSEEMENYKNLCTSPQYILKFLAARSLELLLQEFNEFFPLRRSLTLAHYISLRATEFRCHPEFISGSIQK